MTGYGKRDGRQGHDHYREQIHNYRFLEVAVNACAPAAFEEPGGERSSTSVARWTSRRDRQPQLVAAPNPLNWMPVQLQYHQALKKLQKTRWTGGIDLSVMAGFRDILSLTDQPLVADDWACLC
ncbi:MAG: hypothetical protein U0231_16480 [Nitrospiraceae bacterium]